MCEGLIGRKNIKRNFPNAHLILERKKQQQNHIISSTHKLQIRLDTCVECFKVTFYYLYRIAAEAYRY